MNVYNFCNGDPINRYDYLGMDSNDLPPGIGIGPHIDPNGGVPISPGHGRPNAEEQREIDELFKKNGCHECGGKETGTKTGKAVGDHQPPKKLGTPTCLEPHCLPCSRRQGGLVGTYSRKLKKGAEAAAEWVAKKVGRKIPIVAIFFFLSDTAEAGIGQAVENLVRDTFFIDEIKSASSWICDKYKEWKKPSTPPQRHPAEDWAKEMKEERERKERERNAEERARNIRKNDPRGPKKPTQGRPQYGPGNPAPRNGPPQKPQYGPGNPAPGYGPTQKPQYGPGNSAPRNGPPQKPRYGPGNYAPGYGP